MELEFIPTFVLTGISGDVQRRRHFNILFSNTLVIALFLMWPWVANAVSGLPHVCLFQKCTGLPCPGCGICRSMAAFLRGDVASAWSYHPAGSIIMLFFLWQVGHRIWILLAGGEPDGGFSKIMNRFVVISLFAGWLLKLETQP